MSTQNYKTPVLYACPRCGGEDVEASSWIHLNSGEESDSDPPSEGIWCPDCETQSDHVCLFEAADTDRKCFFHCGHPVPRRVIDSQQTETELG